MSHQPYSTSALLFSRSHLTCVLFIPSQCHLPIHRGIGDREYQLPLHCTAANTSLCIWLLPSTKTHSSIYSGASFHPLSTLLSRPSLYLHILLSQTNFCVLRTSPDVVTILFFIFLPETITNTKWLNFLILTNFSTHCNQISILTTFQNLLS